VIEYRTAFQLEQLIADLAGLGTENVQVTKVGNGGGFKATMVGSAGGVSRSRAQSDITRVSTALNLKYRLKV
jgi:hypothetical protein